MAKKSLDQLSRKNEDDAEYHNIKCRQTGVMTLSLGNVSGKLRRKEMRAFQYHPQKRVGHDCLIKDLFIFIF